MLTTIKPKMRVVVAYLAIPVALFVFAVFVPLVTALVNSFYNWKGGPNKTFNGLANYKQLFADNTFWQSFVHNIFLVVVCIVGQVGLAFIFVLIINAKCVRLKGIHRTFAFFPSTMAAVTIGFIWSMIYDYKRGLLNLLLRVLGHPEAQKVWLNEKGIVMLLVSIPLVWQWIGYYMVILLSAISSIDTEILECAEIDGANAVQRAIHIVFPLIKNTILVCITLCIAGNMKAFDNIYVMTAGGPGNASMVMAMYGYNVSFKQGNLGYGSTISVAIFVLSLAVIGGSRLLVGKMTKKTEQ